MKLRTFTSLIFLILLTGTVHAATTFPLAVRIFIGQTNISPKNLNNELALQGIKTVDAISQLGIEATQPINKELDWGLRYSRKYVKNDEQPDNSLTAYNATIDQDAILILTRYAYFKQEALRADVFIGVGGSNTSYKIKSATQDGELSKKEVNDWVASPFAAAGLSVGVGHKNFYFTVEGGYEYNKVDSFKRTGTINANVDTLDLSGSYFKIGLMFDGLSGSSGK